MRETWKSPHGKKHLSYSPEFAEKVVQLFDQGMAPIDIGKEMGRPSYMIGLILKRAGRRPSDNRRHGNAYPKETVAAMIAFYKECKSTREVEEKFDINRRVVRDILVREKVYEPEWQEKPPSEEKIKSILERWNVGESVATIAISEGIGKGRLKRILCENGIVPQERRLRGSKHGSWKGGRFKGKQDYWWTHVDPDDPMRAMASATGYALEHRLVVARHLGRPLSRAETVHHINGDRGDNRLENLQLRHGAHGKGVVLECADCRSRNIREVPIPASELSPEPPQ